MDHQTVKTIAFTQWDPEGDIKDGDIMSYCARVSNPNNQTNWKTSGKLLNYCLVKEHWSVFEMSSVVMEIKTTRDIGRQILRHRSFHFQEFSQRYAEPGKELGMVTREARYQDTKNRQASIQFDKSIAKDKILSNAWEQWQLNLQLEAQATYNWAVENGIAKEQARAVMPEGMTMSSMYMTGTVRDWIHFCRVRQGKDAQLEVQDVANKAWKELNRIYPFIEVAIETKDSVENLRSRVDELEAAIIQWADDIDKIEGNLFNPPAVIAKLITAY